MSQKSNPCPRCGGHAAATNHARSNIEHATGHAAVHTLKHHPILAALMGGAALVSDLLVPRQYNCSVCGHTFSA